MMLTGLKGLLFTVYCSFQDEGPVRAFFVAGSFPEELLFAFFYLLEEMVGGGALVVFFF